MPVHHFEVWRRDQTDPVFVCGRCMRRRTGQYDSEPRRRTRRMAAQKKTVYKGLLGPTKGRLPGPDSAAGRDAAAAVADDDDDERCSRLTAGYL